MKLSKLILNHEEKKESAEPDDDDELSGHKEKRDVIGELAGKWASNRASSTGGGKSWRRARRNDIATSNYSRTALFVSLS